MEIYEMCFEIFKNVMEVIDFIYKWLYKIENCKIRMLDELKSNCKFCDCYFGMKILVCVGLCFSVCGDWLLVRWLIFIDNW